MYNYNENFKNYRQIKISKKLHNKYFKYRQIKWYTGLITSYEYFISKSNTTLEVCKFTSIIGKIICTILLPFEILFHGIGNILELITEYKRVLFEKKYGSFVTDIKFLYYNNIETEFYIDLKKELSKNYKVGKYEI
jgi:hypothetical protein